MKTLYVRTDANATIGAGHVVRCLSIAHACKEQGMRTVFLVVAIVLSVLSLAAWGLVLCFGDMTPAPIPVG